jgi:hypothetical protein
MAVTEPVLAQARQLAHERHGQRHCRRAEQEVDELRAGKIPFVRHAGQAQDAHYDGNRDGDRVGDRRTFAPGADPLRGQIGAQCHGQTEQGRSRQIDPELVQAGEIRHRDLSLARLLCCAAAGP